LRALQGKVAGVNITGSSGAPGSATRITIRGNSSLLGNNQPLIVIDGIPYDNSEYRTNLGLSGGGAYSNRMADIDPNNVKSITVLRGAAAAALWGSRAANGVLMITTKTGSAVEKRGLGITVSSGIYTEQIANLPDYQNTYGTGTNFNYGQVNGSWGAPFIGTKPYASVDSIPHWYQGRNGFSQFDNVNVPYRAYPNNVEDLFDTGITYDNSISITGGGEKSSIGATFSYLQNDGYVPNTGFDRMSFSVGGTTQLSDALSLGANVNYTRTDQNGVISGVGQSGSNNPSAFARALY
jgi:TonB-dependent SusC/RagA subfamily outer membrane receptor